MKYKQFLALMLSAAMMCSTTVPAFAAGTTDVTMNEASEASVVTEEVTEEVNPEDTLNYGRYFEESAEEAVAPEEEIVPEATEDIAIEETQIEETVTTEVVSNNEQNIETYSEIDHVRPTLPTDRPLQQGADFWLNGDNFIGHYKIVDGNTVDMVYMEQRLIDPEHDEVSIYDVTTITIPATIEKDGVVYNIRNVSLERDTTIAVMMKNLILSEGIESLENLYTKWMESVTLPSTLQSYDGMSGTLGDGTLYGWVDNPNLKVTFPGNEYLTYDANLRYFISSNRGSGSCENIGDEFSLGTKKYQLVSSDTVDVMEVFENKVEDNANIIIPSSVSFRGKTFKVRDAHLNDMNDSGNILPELRTLTVEEGVQKLYFNSDGFYEHVKSITIPASATVESFSEFPYMESWNVAEGNQQYASEDGVLFNKEKTELVNFPASKVVDTYTIPANVHTVKEGGFWHNKGIGHLIIPSTVKTLEEQSLCYLTGLKEVTVDGVEILGEANLYNSKGLEIINLKNVKEVDFLSLSYNPSLKVINVEGNIESMGGMTMQELPSLEAWNVTGTTENELHSKEGVLFYGNIMWSYPASKTGDTYVIPKNTKQIDHGAFNSTKNLKTLICPKGIKFDGAAIDHPVNPIDIYLSDWDKVEFIYPGVADVFMSEVGGRVFAPTQEALDSIPDRTLDGFTKEIGCIPVTSVQVESENVTVKKGNTLDLGVKVTPEYATEKLGYVSSNDICTVDDNGVLKANKVGTGTVTIKGQNGDLKVVNVKVVNPIQSLKFKSNEYGLNKGDSKTLDLVYGPEDADVSNMQWSSDKEEIVTVDKTGKVTAVGAGTTTVRATCDGITATCKVTVKVPLESITMSETAKTVNKGESFDLDVTKNPTDTTEDGAVSWSSNNDQVAKVNSNGKVTAVGAGTTTITATLAGKTTTCNVTVKVPLDRITMSEANKTVNKGESFTLGIQKNPTDTTVEGIVTWDSKNKKVATVDENGKVTAVGVGTATITATLAGKTTTCKVTVKVPLESIAMSETNKTVNKGESFDLDVIKAPVDTTENGTVSWKSDDEQVATVNADGKVTAVGAGTTTITATLAGKTTTCNVTVKVPLDRITLSESDVHLAEGGTVKLNVLYHPTDTTVAKDVKWESDHPEIASVDEKGNVTAKAIGKTVIKATVNGKTASCVVTVNRKAIALESITLSDATLVMTEKETAQVTVKYNPTNTTVDRKVTWSSSDDSVATVDRNGKITALKVGKTTITANVAGKTATCELTVKAKEVALISISLSEENVSLTEGDTKMLNVTCNPTNTTVEKKVNWSTSNASVATVDESGEIKAVGAGTATITATLAGKTATCKVTVQKKEIPLTSISIGTNFSLDINGSKQLSVTYNPSNTTDSKTISWSSDNEFIATVNSEGVVTAHRSGTAMITANVNGIRASVMVTVTVPNVELPFKDVSRSDWFYNEVAEMYATGTMTGTSQDKFSPYEPLARAQFAVMIYRLLGTPETEYNGKFSDVQDGMWYTDAITYANQVGIITGYSDTGKFGPADNINREQLAVMLYRFCKATGKDTSIRGDLSTFADGHRVSSFAKEAMEWAVGTGIISGKYNGTKCDPQGNASRAECAIMMSRFFKNCK